MTLSCGRLASWRLIRERPSEMTAGTLVLWVAIALALWITSGIINLVTSLINLYRALKGENVSWLKQISSLFGNS